MTATIFDLRPEMKAAEARAQVRLAMETVGRELCRECAGPDEIEEVALQLSLQVTFMRVAARSLRECELERRVLAAARAAEARRYGWEPDGEDKR